MKTHTPVTPLFTALAALVVFSVPTQAQNSEKEAADMLRALNIQIGQAQQGGNRARVSQLQKRYLDIQKEWGVHPSPAPRRHVAPAPVAVSASWVSARNGGGKITGYRGGPIRVRKASVTLPHFWDEDRQANQSGRGAVLKFTDHEGNIYTYTGNWAFRGNLSVSLRLGDGDGGVYTGTLTMAPGSGIATVSLVGQGDAEGYNVTFAD
jgi:hypothetical protein